LQKVVKEEDGTRWIANTSADTKLYDAPANPPNTGHEYLTGTDLYAHRTRTHGERFYKLHWSMWQGTESTIEPVSGAERTMACFKGDPIAELEFDFKCFKALEQRNPERVERLIDMVEEIAENEQSILDTWGFSCAYPTMVK